MPLYEFACNACGKEFEELFRSMTERRTMRCPGCASRDVRKRFSTFATAGGDPSKGRDAGGGCATCASGSCATCR